MMLSPVALFVYNRPVHTRRTVEALLSNTLASYTDLIIFADGPKPTDSYETLKNIQEVRQYVEDLKGFKSKEIHFAEANIGCADSIIRGITEVINRFGKVIVVEDDIVTHPFFLRFMNDALDFYEKDERIFTIGGNSPKIDIPSDYPYDIYLSYRSVSWGWATWKNRWEKADWSIENFPIIKHPFFWRIRSFNRGGEDLYNMLLQQYEGSIDAWDIRWEYIMHRHKAYTVIPICCFDINCGIDGSGTHCGKNSSVFFAPMYNKSYYDIQLIENINPNKKILQSYHDFFDFAVTKVALNKRIKRIIKAILKWH